MPEPADRLFVDIIANMETFLDALEVGLKHGSDLLGKYAKEQSEEYKNQFAEPIKQMLLEVEEAQKKAFGHVDIQAFAQIEGRLKNIASLGVQQGRGTEQIMGAMQKAVGGYNDSLKESNSVMGLVNAVSSKLGFNLGGLVSKFSSLSGVLLVVAAGLKQFIDLVKESTAIALKYQQANLNLVRQINKFRTATDDASLTLDVVNEKVAELGDKFGLSELAAKNLIATTLRLTSELGLTGEQALQFAEASTILATGSTNAESAMRLLTRFMRYGIGRGLVDLGITIGDTELQRKAFERGIYTSVDAMDKETRGLLALEIILEKAAAAELDAALAAGSYAARIETAKNKTEEAKEVFGQLFTPLAAAIAEVGSAIEIWLIDKLLLAAKTALISVTYIKSVFQGLSDYTKQEGVQERLNLGRGAAVFGDTEVGPTEPELSAFELMEKDLNENLVALAKWFDALETGGVVIEESLVDPLTDAEQALADFDDAVLAASPDVIKAFDEMAAEAKIATDRIEQSFRDALDDISRDFAQRRTDAEINLNRDLADIDQDAARERVEATLNEQLEETRLVEDHNNALLQLEQQYLMDLEGAVRERDARQVLLLQRRYNVEKGQMQSDFSIRLQRQRQDFQLQLAEIERQRQIKRAERLEQYAEESDDIRTDEDRKRADAKLNYDRELAALEAANKAKEDALWATYINQEKITNLGMNNILKTLNKYLGPSGYFEQAYAYAASLPGQYPLAPITDYATPGTSAFPTGTSAIPMQRGGTILATSPSLIQVAEGGPERVDITPLSQSTGRPKTGGSGGDWHGSIEIGVALSEGLEGEIVDQAMGEMADVFVKLNQGQKRAAR